jgi:23S rRNA pseudouridine2605 synthase
VTAERIQKILARAGIAARRKAEELIREGRVTVNGQVVTIGAKADPAKDAIKVDDKRVQPQRSHRYLLMNKPRGYLTAVSDPTGRPTVMDLVPPAMRRALVPVGRLDYQTEGLLLLTSDGDFAQHLSHPRYGCRKVYEVKVKGVPEEARLDRLRRGIVLDGKRTAPCRIEPQRTTGRSGEEGGNSWFHVELSEGRTRQIREMFFRVGHPVQKLRRVAIGPLSDPTLGVGGVRELSDREVEALRRASAGEGKRPAVKRPARPWPRAAAAAGKERPARTPRKTARAEPPGKARPAARPRPKTSRSSETRPGRPRR